VTFVSDLVSLSRDLAAEMERLSFSRPAAHVYNPLNYARRPHELYLERYGAGRRRVLFWGMNPGPWGMAQTGVPFGEVAAVRDWMGIEAEVDRPQNEHPKRPVEGFRCPRSEVSGRRLWGLMAVRFGTPDRFFADHLVMNYCPLLFLEEGGRNLTPDKLPAQERTALFDACDRHLARVVHLVKPRWLIGVGSFALGRIRSVVRAESASFGGIETAAILHPSPASPRANRGWDVEVTRSLTELGIWDA
jgi:single-strand selective monofunctional uracil DNA glycosylase